MSGEEACRVCGEVGQDRRTVRMSCGYDMSEIGLEKDGTGDYAVLVCKDCRADFLLTLNTWLVGQVLAERRAWEATDAERRTIPYRIAGATRMLTYEEWEAKRAADQQR